MMEITLHVDIPALDRLAKALEGRPIENAAVAALPAAEATQAAVEVPQAAAEAPQAVVEAAPAEEPAPKEEPKEEPKAAAYTLDQVQRAAARMRDQGKLGAVTGMFDEFGIKKLSDLKGENLQDFAQRLIGLGASL